MDQTQKISNLQSASGQIPDDTRGNVSPDEQPGAADLDKLPQINWGALLMPAVWGPAHGQWATIFFYPIWLLADNCFTHAVFYGGLATVFAVIVFAGTAALTIFYAKTAGRSAYLRAASKMTREEYLARERVWVVISALIALLFMGLATWYNLAIRLPAGLSA